MKRSVSSERWLKEHFADPYVKKAQQEGYRCRAAYKLLEIHKKYHLIKPPMNVVDLGAAPGGWSQVVAKLLQHHGKIFALDILPMEPIAHVDFIQGDFQEETVYGQLREQIGTQKIDVVLSDIAPNMSGIIVSDQAKVFYLAELALDFAQKVLKPGGTFLVKVFQGGDFEAYHKQLRANFKSIKVCKPDASRDRSKEVYLLAQNYQKIEVKPD